MVRILVTPQPSNSRAISLPISRRNAVSIIWFKKLPTFRIPPGRTFPSLRILFSISSMNPVSFQRFKTKKQTRMSANKIAKGGTAPLRTHRTNSRDFRRHGRNFQTIQTEIILADILFSRQS